MARTRSAAAIAGVALFSVLLAGCGGPNSPLAPGSSSPVTQQAASHGDGTYTVGATIKPAVYRTTGPAVPGGMCSATLNYGIEVGGTVSETILNNGDPRGTFEVTIRPNDTTFETSGCAPWVEQVSMTTPESRKGRATNTFAEDAFISTLQQRGLVKSDKQREIRRAMAICGIYDKGMSHQQVIEALMANGFSANDAGYFAGAATIAFCPQHTSKTLGK